MNKPMLNGLYHEQTLASSSDWQRSPNLLQLLLSSIGVNIVSYADEHLSSVVKFTVPTHKVWNNLTCLLTFLHNDPRSTDLDYVLTLTMCGGVPFYKLCVDRHSRFYVVANLLIQGIKANASCKLPFNNQYYLVTPVDASLKVCFLTLDKQLAYEVRKGATTNLYDADGNFSPVAHDFCMAVEYADCVLTTHDCDDHKLLLNAHYMDFVYNSIKAYVHHYKRGDNHE